MILLAIDPGWSEPGSARAHFDGERLVRVDFWSWRRPGVPVTVDQIVIEKPQEDNRTPHVRDSYAKLCRAYDYALEHHAGPVRRYTPRQWKGSCPKPQHHARLWERLTDAERAVLGGTETRLRIRDACERGALNRWSKPGARYYGSWNGHNLLDAVALGAFHIGRISK